jgi:predicted metalloprotease
VARRGEEKGEARRGEEKGEVRRGEEKGEVRMGEEGVRRGGYERGEGKLIRVCIGRKEGSVINLRARKGKRRNKQKTKEERKKSQRRVRNAKSHPTHKQCISSLVLN